MNIILLSLRKRSISISVNSGGMSRPTQPKKVLPPSVPEVYRHSCSNFSENETTDQMLNDPTMLQGQFPPMLSLSFTARGEPLTHKAAVYYHQQLALQEDQGIDMQCKIDVVILFYFFKYNVIIF